MTADVGAMTLEDATEVGTKETDGLGAENETINDDTVVEVTDGASIDAVGASCGTTEEMSATDATGASLTSSMLPSARANVSSYSVEMESVIAWILSCATVNLRMAA